MSLDLSVMVNTGKAGQGITKFTIKATSNVKKMERQSVQSAKKMSLAFSGLTKTLGTLGLVGGIAGLISGLKETVRLSGIQEKSYAKLNANLENVLVSFKGYERGTVSLNQELERQNKLLITQSEALQNLTAFGDAQIQSGQAMFATFALTADEIEKLTPRMLDMAAAQEKATGVGLQLEDVAIAIGKALAVNTLGGLKRTGVVMDEFTEKEFRAAGQTEKLSILLKVLDDNYSGVAEAIGNTDAGKLSRIGNIFGDIGESIGRVVLNEALLTGLDNFAKGLQEVVNVSESEGFGQALDKTIFGTLSLAIPDIVDGFKAVVRAGNELETEGVRALNSFLEAMFPTEATERAKAAREALKEVKEEAVSLGEVQVQNFDEQIRLRDEAIAQLDFILQKEDEQFLVALKLQQSFSEQAASQELTVATIDAQNERWQLQGEIIARNVELQAEVRVQNENAAESADKFADAARRAEIFTKSVATNLGRAVAEGGDLREIFLRIAALAATSFIPGPFGALAGGFLGSFDHGGGTQFNTGSNGRSRLFTFAAHDGENVDLNVTRPGAVTNNTNNNNASFGDINIVTQGEGVTAENVAFAIREAQDRQLIQPIV